MNHGSAYQNNNSDAGSMYDNSDDPNGSSFSMQKGLDQNSGKMQDKHSFIMNRRRGTAGPLNPKQADLMI